MRFSKITDKDIAFCRMYAKAHNVKLYLVKYTVSGGSGEYSNWTTEQPRVYVRCVREATEDMRAITRTEFLSTFFHEMGHHVAFTRGIWKVYHNRVPVYRMNEEQILGVLRTGLRAERWVDNWAEQEMKRYYPKMNYIAAYSLDYGIKWYKEKWLPGYRERLKEIRQKKYKS